MNKRNFLKATGITFVASLFTTPFTSRNDNSNATAREGKSLEDQVAELRKLMEIETRERKEMIKTLSQGFFVGAVVAIPYDDEDKIPVGWHLCDGSDIPRDKEFEALRELVGDCFPDYRGYFLRGLDKGRGIDPDDVRTIGSVQETDNLSHSHYCNDDGLHGHYIRNDGEHYHEMKVGFPTEDYHQEHGFTFVSNVNHTGDVRFNGDLNTNTDGRHDHDCQKNGVHNHVIEHKGGKESRPVNVAVNYVIKYA